ncbi:hypothetical protein ES707_20425 [subsurface metagenome]
MTDQEETFYSSLDIDYNFKSESGTALFAEGSATINSDATTFEAIDYCRNPDMSSDSKLVGYGSELFDNFEIYEDDRSIIYVADIDMDGEPDYKHTIDVDGDGDIDIVKYGINDPQGSGEIIWHTVIQDFHSEETKVSRKLGEEMRTEWFDLDDQMFAHYDFNIGKLLLIIVTLPLLPYHITKMMLPDVDYWAQKSTQRLVHKEEHVKSNFYSIQVDNEQDGYVDSQINFESTDVDVYYEVNEFKKTILAAKYLDILTFIGEYVLRSICSLFTGSQEDVVFNEYLTEEHLETKDFSTSNLGAQMNAETLSATYRKFTKNITTTYIDSFKYSTLTVIDYNEGEVEEHRIYKDDFETSEGTSAEGFFEDLFNKHAITNVDTGAQSTVRFDPEIPYSHPANISWTGETWGSDNVPVKYDSLQVIGGDDSYSTNYFEKTIIIRIPNRYSLYNDFGKISRSKVENDGWVEFEVEGIFITPEDGQVYYTSDVYAFKDGTAKTKGHYFYVDSDLNDFYETVYIISNLYTVSRSGTPKYDVISIGLNYDGIHDFAPYEKLPEKNKPISDFSNLAKESAMFGTDWVYNFNNLKHNELLIEEETIWDEYKPKDQIFEIYKLVDKSKNNPKFSELFYEIRHKTYAIAWEQYKKQLTGDIIEQVFMSVTASLLSAAVEAAITASTLGFGWLGAKGMATLTYVAVYTLMTKFSIDRKLHEAESKERSKTFYPASNAKVDPVSLNEKCIYDRVLQDTMAAALLGHPGGYYQTVSGGEPGSSYTGHLVVSPPNLARVLNSFGGFLDLLWENLWNAGESDPDAYTALDFDDLNLDYLLMSSELPFYNTKLHYIYHNTEYIFDTYNMYSFNTLGALETQVREGSKGQFNAIRPTCIDGAPQYEFIDNAIYNTVLPQQILYRPVVLSETRYNQIQPALGRLTVKVQCKDYDRTLGINPYDMSDVEQKVYEAKVPLNDNGFEYPIKYIFIDVVNFDVSNGFSYFAQDLIVNESDYAIDCGNLYFKKSIEAIVSEKYSGFEDFLAQSWASELIESTIYYNIRVVFDRFVPDTTDETNSLVLAQATSYAIMDYFNQYTYAEISSNMISEIAYTETLTFWSTLISAPLVYFGSWAISAGVGKMFGEAGSNAVKSMLQKSIMGGLVGTVVSPIKEVFQEIIEDGFREALLENLVSIAGGTDDLGFWLSSLSTSYREVKGALGELTFGETNLKNTFSLIYAISSGDVDTRLEIEQRITQDLKQRKEAETAKKEQMSFWDKMLKTDFLKGLFMVIPSVFFGSFSFVALSGLKKITTSSIKLSPAAYAKYESLKHIGRKKSIGKAVGGQSAFSSGNMFTDRVLGQTKKPAELDGVKSEIDDKFEEQQESDKKSPPLLQVLSSINSNPKQIQAKEKITKAFNEIQLSNWISELSQDYRFKDKKEEFEKIRKVTRKLDFRQRIDEITKVIKNVIREKYPNSLRFVDITSIELYDPNFVLVGKMARNKQLFMKEYRGRESYVPLITENTISKLTTVEVLDYLNKQHYGFDKSTNLVMMMMDGTTIPDHVILTDWLDAKSYSIYKDIIVLPANLPSGDNEMFTEANWEAGTPSPCYPLLERLYREVGHLFERAGLITHSGRRDLSYDEIIYELSDFIYGDSQIITHDRIGIYKSGLAFKPNSWTQYRYLFEFIGKLESSLPGEAAKKYVSELISIYDEHAFSVFDGKAKNPFYNDARFIAYHTAYVLQKHKIVDSNSIDGLTDNFFLDGYELRNFYKDLDKNLIKAHTPADHPRNRDKIYVLDTLKERIQEALDAKQFDLEGNELTQDKKEIILGEIFSLIDDFDKKTQSYWNWYKLFTEGDSDYIRKKTLNSEFLLELVFSNNLLSQIQYKQDLEKLFWGDIFRGSLDAKLLNHDSPTLSTLLTMKFVVSRWSESDFEALSRKFSYKTVVDVTPQDLKQAKNVIINKINEYIKSRGYIADEFTRYGIKYTQKDILPEFNFVNSLFDFATELEYFTQFSDTGRDISES